MIACGGDNTKTTNAVSGDNAAESAGATLATVNGLAIGSKEFEQSAARKVPADGDALSDEEKRAVLDALVAEKVLYLEARAQGLENDPKVQKVMINTLMREAVYAQVKNSDFDEAQLRAYFEAHPDEFVVPEKVQIKRLLIRVQDDRSEEDAKAEAQRLRREIAKDPKNNFKDIATKHSEDPYRRRGGDVGFVSAEGKPGLDEDIVTKAFGMEVGSVSDAFKTKDGYNVVYVPNKREKVERTFQQMKASVLRKVKNATLKDKQEAYVASLKATATIDVDEAQLSKVEIRRAARPSGVPGMEMPTTTLPTPSLAPPAGAASAGAGEAAGD
jgi:parvulin-like peptidyl-prolyl isomerase